MQSNCGGMPAMSYTNNAARAWSAAADANRQQGQAASYGGNLDTAAYGANTVPFRAKSTGAPKAAATAVDSWRREDRYAVEQQPLEMNLSSLFSRSCSSTCSCSAPRHQLQQQQRHVPQQQQQLQQQQQQQTQQQPPLTWSTAGRALQARDTTVPSAGSTPFNGRTRHAEQNSVAKANSLEEASRAPESSSVRPARHSCATPSRLAATCESAPRVPELNQQRSVQQASQYPSQSASQQQRQQQQPRRLSSSAKPAQCSETADRMRRSPDRGQDSARHQQQTPQHQRQRREEQQQNQQQQQARQKGGQQRREQQQPQQQQQRFQPLQQQQQRQEPEAMELQRQRQLQELELQRLQQQQYELQRQIANEQQQNFQGQMLPHQHQHQQIGQQYFHEGQLQQYERERQQLEQQQFERQLERQEFERQQMDPQQQLVDNGVMLGGVGMDSVPRCRSRSRRSAPPVLSNGCSADGQLVSDLLLGPNQDADAIPVDGTGSAAAASAAPPPYTMQTVCPTPYALGPVCARGEREYPSWKGARTSQELLGNSGQMMVDIVRYIYDVVIGYGDTPSCGSTGTCLRVLSAADGCADDTRPDWQARYVPTSVMLAHALKANNGAWQDERTRIRMFGGDVRNSVSQWWMPQRLPWELPPWLEHRFVALDNTRDFTTQLFLAAQCEQDLLFDVVLVRQGLCFCDDPSKTSPEWPLEVSISRAQDCIVNGIYALEPYLFEGRPCYRKGQCILQWCPQRWQWALNDLNGGTWAFANGDFGHPVLTRGPWAVWNGQTHENDITFVCELLPPAIAPWSRPPNQRMCCAGILGDTANILEMLKRVAAVLDPKQPNSFGLLHGAWTNGTRAEVYQLHQQIEDAARIFNEQWNGIHAAAVLWRATAKEYWLQCDGIVIFQPGTRADPFAAYGGCIPSLNQPM